MHVAQNPAGATLRSIRHGRAKVSPPDSGRNTNVQVAMKA